jgi:hypothetical protein
MESKDESRYAEWEWTRRAEAEEPRNIRFQMRPRATRVLEIESNHPGWDRLTLWNHCRGRVSEYCQRLLVHWKPTS